MSSVLVATLIADPSKAPLSEATVDRAAQALNGIERRRWLDEGVAADLVFTGDLKAKRAALERRSRTSRSTSSSSRLPIAVKRLLVADMDSTLIGQECVDELADFAGVGARVAAITERAMRGEVAFAPALRERVALLQGLTETVIRDVLKDRITLNRGARTLVSTMRANGAYVAIVSGGFRQFTSAIRERLGADEDRANVLMIEDGRLTGKVMEPILGQGAKLHALEEIAAARGARSRTRSRLATAPTIFRCCKRPASASPIAPSPKSPRERTPASSARISQPCSMRRASRARISSRGEGSGGEPGARGRLRSCSTRAVIASRVLEPSTSRATRWRPMRGPSFGPSFVGRFPLIRVRPVALCSMRPVRGATRGGQQ